MRIKVSVEKNERHKCDPSPATVRPGETIHWEGNVFVFFPGETPFEEGRGPFPPGKGAKVRRISMTEPKTFKFETVVDGKLRPTDGDIIVRES